MSRLLASSAAVALLSTAAFAADLPLPMEPVEEVFAAPAYDWTGLYIGGQGGFAWGEFDYDDPTEFDAGGAIFNYGDFSFDADGPLAGGHIGYNMQSGYWVFGVEVDAQWTDIEGSRRFVASIFDLFPSATFDTLAESELEWFGTARARIGAAFDRFHIYATGGLAYGEIDSTLSFPPTAGGPVVFIDRDSEFHFGAAGGAGVEFALTDNIIFGAEGLYVHLFDEEHAYLIAGDTYTMDIDLSAVLARGSVSFKF